MINVLVLSHSLIPSVLLCGLSQLEYLKSINEVDYRFSRAHLLSDEMLTWADIVIFLRSESGFEACAAQLCQKYNIHSVYVLDDDLLNIPDYLSSAKYYNRKDTQRNIKKTMSNCNTFLTSSFVLLEKYGNRFKNAFQIHEPSLNVIDKKEANDKIRIGFAGSIDRAQDINEILEEALTKVLNKYQDQIEIEFMGAKPDIVDKYNLTYIPYKDSYEKYTETIKERNWDIGLAPMPETSFHECKYFNKYVEYASFGIAGVYSNVKPYTYGIKEADNGLLVNNDTDSWYYAICRLIEDNILRNTISRNCLNEARTIYSLETLSKDYLNKITTNFTKNDTKLEVKGVVKYKIKYFFIRAKNKIVEEKWRLPIWAYKKIMKVIKGEERSL